MKLFYLISLVLGYWYTSVVLADTERWYSDEQVKQGEKVFAANCASCHGKNAEATKDWKKRDANGNLVPPPLNGTAHAWHHPLKLLRHTVRKGGAPVGGVMPPFEAKLSADEIDSVIAWFQSKWSDEIYGTWNQRNADQGFIPVKQQKQAKPEDSITRLLQKRLPGAVVGPATTTQIEGLYRSKVGPDFAYLLSSGRYALIGELIDLQTGKNLTALAKGKDNLNLLNAFSESDMVVFPAKGNTEHVITILTDTDCPFCRKLHKEVPALQKAGIKVRYIAFPRNGSAGSGYKSLKSVWCAKDRLAAMDIAKGIRKGELTTADCAAANAVNKGFELGRKIGIRGTPAIFLPDGRLLEGYVSAKQLIQLLQANI